MGEVINLRRARKARARAADVTKAATNRATFGRTLTEKAHAKAEIDRQRRELDGVRRGESRRED